LCGVYEDDPSQVERARRAWQAAVNGGGAFLTITAMIELAWVLRVAAKLERGAIAEAMRRLCDAQGVTVEAETRVRRALALFEAGRADFSDYLLLEAAREVEALPVVTFDQDFAGESGVKLV
jgi:predicted nucleic-acid-binding protein